jgi:hypothetical protein
MFWRTSSPLLFRKIDVENDEATAGSLVAPVHCIEKYQRRLSIGHDTNFRVDAGKLEGFADEENIRGIVLDDQDIAFCKGLSPLTGGR